LSEFGDTLGAHNCAKLEKYLEAPNLEAIVREGGEIDAETMFIG